jgi:hypothetical protein
LRAFFTTVAGAASVASAADFGGRRRTVTAIE